MTIRVLIEREVDQAQESKLRQMMTQARAKAMKAKGYISGETLRSADNPNRFLVISNWNSIEDWRTWEKSAERLELQKELAPMLIGKEKCQVFTHF